MPVRLTAYPPEEAAIARSLHGNDALRIGRAPDSDLCLPHASVSRNHAALRRVDGGWLLQDLGSKNGSFLDGRRVGSARIANDCWLRFGDVHCEFASLAPDQVERGESAFAGRRATAAAQTARIDAMQRLDEVLEGSLRGVVELAQCERGFVLLDGDGGLAVRASLALDPQRLAAREFSGSVGAVRRALASRRGVVANDIGNEPWLAARASVVASGLRAVVCLPLLDGDGAFGAIYADRKRPGPPITTLDLELLEAFAEHAALWITVRRASAALARDAAAVSWAGILGAHASEPA